jgi:menaquinone-dependent protoporphyrinogen oxidase
MLGMLVEKQPGNRQTGGVVNTQSEQYTENQSVRRLTRRGVLKISGITFGAAALTCAGLGVLAAQPPRLELLEPNPCGGTGTMQNKILVAYATKAGSTAEIAEFIGQTLCENGAVVDVRPVKEARSLEGYRAVIVGSAIRMGRWLPEAVKFVEVHKTELAHMPTAYFLVSLFLSEGTPEMRATVAAYLDPVRAILEPSSIGLFPGKMDYSKLSWLDRQAAKMVKAPEGDHRDWQAIWDWTQAWAQAVQQDGLYATQR